MDIAVHLCNVRGRVGAIPTKAPPPFHTQGEKRNTEWKKNLYNEKKAPHI